MSRFQASLMLALSLVCCRGPSPEQARAEARRLRAAVGGHRAAYLQSIEAEKVLISETLAWLEGPLATRDRGLLAAESRRFTEKWARVYFMPREIHAALRQEQYMAPTVRSAHALILRRLKSRYFTLHDYQRYAQHASETGARHTPLGRMPAPLASLKARLTAHAQPRDEISPILNGLP